MKVSSVLVLVEHFVRMVLTASKILVILLFVVLEHSNLVKVKVDVLHVLQDISVLISV
jgi:hypothetical protein